MIMSPIEVLSISSVITSRGNRIWLSHVKDEAARETGLRVKIKVFIEAEKWLKSVSIESPRFDVWVNDFDNSCDLKVKADLKVSEDLAVNVLLFSFQERSDRQ